MIWLKLALREIRNNYRFSLFFIFNLTLGLLGFIMLDSFKVSLEKHMSKNSKNILTADLASVSRRPFTEKEIATLRAKIPQPYQESKQVRFFSMVQGSKNSRLVEVLGIMDNFPLYGKMVLKNQGETSAELIQNELSAPNIWVYSDLLIALGLELGDQVQIGQSKFTITGIIEQDPSQAFSTFGMAARIYMGLEQIEKTGLIQRGSRVFYGHLFKIPEESDSIALAKEIQSLFQSIQKSTDLRVYSHREANEQVGRILKYLNNYLGLIALIALFLAGVGAAYLFRSYLYTRFKDMAILLSLGATHTKTLGMAMIQLAVLGAISAFISMIFAYILIPSLPFILQEFIPGNFEASVSTTTLIIALLIGSIGSFIVCFPVLMRIRSLQPMSLFHESNMSSTEGKNSVFFTFLNYLPVIIFYWIMAVWQANSLRMGSLFVGGFLFSLFVLGGVAILILYLAKFFSARGDIRKRIALRNLTRNPMGTISCFLAIAMGALLMNLIPQIHQGLQEEIQQPETMQIPELFLFDIQPEQIDALQFFAEKQEYSMQNVAPMTAARLEAVNTIPFTDHVKQYLRGQQEFERAERFKSREYNLSYRAGLLAGEEIEAGVPFKGTYDWDNDLPAQLSVSSGFAERVGLGIGDLLEFDVQGVPIEAQITNLRRVKWNNFQPNFFFVMQPGVLENAPSIYLASISGLNGKTPIQVQNEIVDQFPNISVIDVTKLIQRLLSLSNQISLAIYMMAYLSIIAGLVVVFSIARHEAQSRTWEINLLKVLGSNFKDVQRIIQFEFGLLGASAAIFGVLLSLVMSYGVSLLLFENIWSFTWDISIFTIVTVSMLSVAIAMFATHHVLAQKPLKLLRTT